MTIDVDAVYENGGLRLKQPVDLPENAEVHVTIQTNEEAKTPLGRRLRELRAEIAKSGGASLGVCAAEMSLDTILVAEPWATYAAGRAGLGWDEIETEVALRRGGWREGS
jgi:predicted DNA-binding antitoxin AbrB/MazE fold protein